MGACACGPSILVVAVHPKGSEKQYRINGNYSDLMSTTPCHTPQGPMLAFIFAVKELLDSCRSGASEERDECDADECERPTTSAPPSARSPRISTTGLATGAAGVPGSGGLPINVAFIFEGEGE